MKVTFQSVPQTIVFQSEDTVDAFVLGKLSEKMKGGRALAHTSSAEVTISADELLALAVKK